VIPYQWKNAHFKCDRQTESYQQQLLESTLCIVIFAIQSGTILERWINATNIMIPKKNGFYKVTDYRNIHIYECDMNAMLPLKWKEALKQSEEQNVIILSQVGSQKQRSSQFPIHIEISQLEISRLTRKEYGQINYDAKACYDRILPNIAAMSSRVHGVNNKIVNLHNNFLLKMKYNVMIEGASCKKTFQSTDETTIYGTGQGCGNSPIIWLFISNILIQMFSNEAIGAKYTENAITPKGLKPRYQRMLMM
jgi:hypothetical protein